MGKFLKVTVLRTFKVTVLRQLESSAKLRPDSHLFVHLLSEIDTFG